MLGTFSGRKFCDCSTGNFENSFLLPSRKYFFRPWWIRRLTLFYKILNNLTSLYTKEPIPSSHQLNYFLRDRDAIIRIGARTETFQSTFYLNCNSEWNKLDPEIRLAPSIGIFKKKLLSLIRLPAKSVSGIYDPIGLSHLSQIRVGLSELNFHKFRHNF